MISLGWYRRPVAAACLALSIASISGSVLARADYGPLESPTRSAYWVAIRHYGVDAREMERSVAIPLEDALSAIPGAVETSSSSEYGKVRAAVRLARGSEGDAAYEAVREAAQRVYEALPGSAQRPEIGYASEGRGPVWVAAAYSAGASEAELARVLERAVKPALERLEGAGEVELAGAGPPELSVAVDERAALAVGLSISDVAGSLARSDSLEPAGEIRSDGIIMSIAADGRFSSADEISSAMLPASSGTPARLGELATVSAGERRPEALSRVGGKRAATIAVKPGGSANLASLSKALAEASGRLAAEHGLEFRVLLDVGADLSESFRSTVGAALQGAAAVAVASACLLGAGSLRGGGYARRATIAAAATVPAILVVSAAALAALGYGIDRHVLAGAAVGLGAAVDSVLLSAERLGGAGSRTEGLAAMRELAPTIAAGTATTLVALVPLAGLDFIAEGVARIAAAIASVCVTAYVAAIVFLPPLVLSRRRMTASPRGLPPGSPGSAAWLAARRVSSRVARLTRRALARNASWCAARPLAPLSLAAALSGAGLLAVLLAPVDAGVTEDEGGVYVHVEFEPGTAMEIVDERLAGYALSLAEVPGVGSVQSTARRGSGSVLLSLDKSSADRSLAAKAARAARETPVQGGFAWVPRPSRDERAWSLVVAGDDDRECRDIAAEAARAVAALPFVAQTVLDFKDGPGDVTIRPDRERSAAMGIPFSSAAAALRRAVFGPVAYKRVDGAGETDVRVAASRDGKPRPRDIGATLAQTGNGAARVDSFSRIGLEKDVSRIRRLDRRRVASISARCAPLDPREARASFYAAVSGVALPPGYSIEFDRDAIEAADRLGGAGASFALAASLAFMIAAALSESFGAPLAVIAALPPSLAVPALLLAVSGSPMDAATASAFVAVSGMSVNASFLTFDERRRVAARPGAASAYDAYRMTRARIGSLAATSATSVAGSLPFLFLSDPGSGLVRSLAFVAATGTAVSFLSALTVIPALASAAPRLFNGPATSASLMKEGSIQ